MTNYKARKTVYKGIEMRSRLEAGFAQWLDRWDFQWTYEPQAFAGEQGQYLPDFRVEDLQVQLSDKQLPVFIEVKPDKLRNDETHRSIANRMSIIWHSVSAHLLIVQPDMVAIVDYAPGPFMRMAAPMEAAKCDSSRLEEIRTKGVATSFPWRVDWCLDNTHSRPAVGGLLPPSLLPITGEFWKPV